jgi:hypothetical protein
MQEWADRDNCDFYAKVDPQVWKLLKEEEEDTLCHKVGKIRNVDRLAMTWKEVIIAFFKVLSQHLPGRTGGNHEKHQLG